LTWFLMVAVRCTSWGFASGCMGGAW
jgi:hypothetical protein